jgi:hypothetical protein
MSNVRRGSEVRGSMDTHISSGHARHSILLCDINRIYTSGHVTRARLSLLLILLLPPSTTDESMVNA